MKDYSKYSFWLETCGDDLTPRPALDGSVDVDVAILGGGFTGLWTAYHLLRREPSLRVAVVEAEIAGFGASGRNGGWCFAGFPVGPAKLTERYGVDTARAVSLAMYDSVDDVGATARQEGFGHAYAKGGELEVARAAWDLPKLEGFYREFEAVGLGDHYAVLDQRETAARIRVEGAVGAFFNREGAAVQPAAVARGLARAVERRGGTIYERTRVTSFSARTTPDGPASLHTPRGDVRAKAIVLAGEAYLAGLRDLRRQIVPLTSHIVVTEPLPEDAWREIGWAAREVVGGFGTTGGYLNHTADGRIAFGPYRATYPFGSKVTDAIDRNEAIFAHARRSAVAWFPALRDVRFTHAWGGVFGVPRDHMPVMRYDRRTGIATGRGYVGEGVATANLSGRVLADLITERDTDLTRLPMTRHVSRRWEPEPLRWLGVTFVRRSRDRTLAEVERTGKVREKPTLAQRIWDQ